MDAINPDHYKRLPAEAIEIIEAAIDNAPSNRDAYLHGQALKYLLRCWHKNGIEDLKKARWYLDRLIELFDKSETEQPVIKQSLTTEPPDGWRWLEVGETLRRGDTTKTMDEIPEVCIGTACFVKHFAFRRNKFEIGEKVVHVDDKEPVVYVVDKLRGDGAVIAYRENGTGYSVSPKLLAPYIEEQS